jgi:putative peptidoglycan lipid II flippase
LGLTGASVVAGLVSWGVSFEFQKIWSTETLLLQLLQVSVSGLVGLGIFALIATQMKLPEVDIFVARLRQKFGR